MTFRNYCSCIVICFSYNYLIVDGKYYLSIKKIVKDLRNQINLRLKLWARVPIAVSLCPAAAHMYW